MANNDKEYLSGTLSDNSQPFSGSVGGDLVFGVPGTTFFPEVTEEGVIQWENDGGKENPPPVNIRGPVGPVGPQGSRGIQGPQGETGPQGPQGERGETGATGATGPQGETGQQGKAFTYADFTAEQLEGLRGPVGPQGPEGPQGKAFTYEDFTAEQLAALTGPQGPQGETGPKGEQGKQGEQGAQGIQGETGPQGIQGEAGPQGPQGATGQAGANATINGVNALTLKTGSGLSGSQSGDTYTLSLASHNQAASTITAGTFAGQVVANSPGQTPGTSLLRNSKLVAAETNPTVNGEINWTYE